ncbi:MAG: glycosyltransferase family 4 protein [Alphaproteobacteria bacterium]|nr:MAG: glycosyltransferase family 4 protein [Alphaproteobacteria bacterium]
MRILTFSTLYPNAAQPVHGIFVENRLRHLMADCGVEAVVVAPVPWFPFKSERFKTYGKFARVPFKEERHGITVYHPRYVHLPKVGMHLAPRSIYLRCRPLIARLLDKDGPFDLIDAHYFYPDGVAAAMLARHFDLPLTITARGTDINLIPEYPGPRRQILKAADTAGHLITVCDALRDRLIELGVAPQKITALRNGVDLDHFHPGGREETRAKLGLTRTTLLSVGHLIERKGHHLVIECLKALPDCDLLIAGDGEERRALEHFAERLHLQDRVRFLGQVPHEDLQSIYAASDVLILASSREGWPNVLLEAMACGTPVVATDVWGSGEVVRSPIAGRLAAARTSHSLTESLQDLLAQYPDRSEVRQYAEGFSWEATSRGQFDIFNRLIAPSADSRRHKNAFT